MKWEKRFEQMSDRKKQIFCFLDGILDGALGATAAMILYILFKE